MTPRVASQLSVTVKHRPVLDPEFVPAVLWNRAYEARVAETAGGGVPLAIALVRPDGTTAARYDTKVLPQSEGGENLVLNEKYVDRLVKFLLWQRGGSRLYVGGCEALADALAERFAEGGTRAFDSDLIGAKAFGEPVRVLACSYEETPREEERDSSSDSPVGRNLGGCRIGFDLGGSDRKSAAVVDGTVVFSEEVKWDPYFESDPSYHIEGIHDSLKRAAAHLPRVDAIGGSAAGIYVNNEPRVSSLFRGVSTEDFDRCVRGIFRDLKERWNDVPFEVANDGEVTALAGAMELGCGGVLGLAMGTSQAAGYVDEGGSITTWINELAFCPVDYRDDAPADEWSGDVGCGVQYFSQQAVARLAVLAGIEFNGDMPLPERLIEVQRLMAKGDEKAHKVYQTIGAYFGYSIAHYADFYDIRHLLILGRVTSGEGGQLMIDTAMVVLEDEFPALAKNITISTPSEQLKRHGQAIAAASLPKIS